VRANLGRVAHLHEHLSAHSHDRLHERRKDEAWLDQRWADPGTRVLVVSGTRVRPHHGAATWVSPGEAPEGLRVLLGDVDGRAWFALVTGPEAAQVAPLEWLPLRGLLPVLADGPADHVAPTTRPRRHRWCCTPWGSRSGCS